MIDRELLEQLRVMLGCLFISDLKNLDKSDLFRIINSIKADEFSKKEWQRTVEYLTGCTPDMVVDETALKNYLCNYYID